MNYDISNPENYEPLYRFLAKVKAQECGASSVFFAFDGDKSALNTEILATVPGIKSEKIYIIFKEDDGSKGMFLFGGRNQRNPWDKYAVTDNPDPDVAQ